MHPDRNYKIDFTWEDLNRSVRFITNRVKELDFQPRAVTGIPRGGLIPAVMLSHQLDIPFIARIPKESMEILVVDDIIFTGHSMHNFLENVPYSPFTKFRTASIHYHRSASFVPDIFHHELLKDDIWVQYPFETEKTSKIDYTE